MWAQPEDAAAAALVAALLGAAVAALVASVAAARVVHPEATGWVAERGLTQPHSGRRAARRARSSSP